jgi:hypothetical protein
LERCISAILAADVVGCLRLLELGEAARSERLWAHRKGLFEPEIRNPETSQAERARVVLPIGFEFSEVEFASATTKATGAIRHDRVGRHAHFAMPHLGPSGTIQ